MNRVDFRFTSRAKITHSLFILIFREMIAKTMPCSDVSKLEGHLFRLYDTNCDEHIDFVEFMNIFKMLAGGDPKEIMTNLFRVFDLDGDQQITVLEMETLVKDLYR